MAGGMPAALATDSRSPSPPATVSSAGNGVPSRCNSSPDPASPTSRSTAPRTRSGTAPAANSSRETSVDGYLISASLRGPRADRRVSTYRRPRLACSGSSRSRRQSMRHIPETLASITSRTPLRERRYPPDNAIQSRLAYAKYLHPFLSTPTTSSAHSSPPTKSPSHSSSSTLVTPASSPSRSAGGTPGAPTRWPSTSPTSFRDASTKAPSPTSKAAFSTGDFSNALNTTTGATRSLPPAAKRTCQSFVSPPAESTPSGETARYPGTSFNRPSRGDSRTMPA